MWGNTVVDKTYLDVPYVEKDEAKALGAKWDGTSKKWYCNSADVDKFDKWVVTPAMTIDDLSDEQQAMIMTAKDGKNILVDACIGSGKTTSIQVLCNELSDKKVLYLTYNTLLKVDAKEKIKGRNVTVTNYHGFAYMCLSRTKIEAGISDLIQSLLRNKDKITVPKYDVLVIDEYQDIEQEIAEMLECIKEANPEIQIIAVGDMAQKIYDKTTLKVPEFINSFLGEYEKITFTKCFRLSAKLASRLGNIWNKEINGVNEKCNVETMELGDAVFFLAKQKPSDLLCLGSRTGGMSKALNILERQNPEKFNKNTVYASIREDGCGKTMPDKTTAIFTTFDSSKGLERPICVVFDYTEDYWQTRMNLPDTNYEILRNIFCVAMSRGKKRIIIVKEPDKEILADNVVGTPVMNSGDYTRPFLISEMFDFKYKEDVEDCFKQLKIQKIKSEKKVIDVKTADALIDISPCVGVLQQASFFEKYDIDEQIQYTMDKHDNRPPIRTKKKKEELSLEEKILYLVAYNTYQDRYVEQVKCPILTNEQLNLIHNRLGESFTGKEEVERTCSFGFYDTDDNYYAVEGRCDVVKDDTIYELKFVEEFNHEHYLQLACYLFATGYEKGVLWNVRTNEKAVVSIKNKSVFLNCVARCITKGRVKKAFPESNLFVAV